MSTSLIYVDKEPVSLASQIGKGGEGEVFAVSDNAALAAKIYTVADGAAREPKISAMIQAQLAKRAPLVSFPISIARKKDGKFAGFTMRLIAGHRPLHDLYSPGSRKNKFPQADFRFLVRSASNIARAVASVHHSGCVIGDINHSSILVSKKATVALIDADSFQIGTESAGFYCIVGVPEYTPPELQGKSLARVFRTPNHDAFGLAIVTFQLLFMGRHPFVGTVRRGEIPPLHDAIRDFRYVYAEDRDVGMDQPPGTPVVSEFSAEIAKMFERAFSQKTQNNRPTAIEWVRALDVLEKSLAQCENNALHYIPRDGDSCPWCEMDERLGTILFHPYLSDIDITVGSFDPGSSGFDVDAISSKIRSINCPPTEQITPHLEPFSPSPSPAAVAAARSGNIWPWLRGASLVIAALTVFAAPSFLIVWLPLALFAAFGGSKKSRIDASRFSRHFVDVERKWIASLDAWRMRSGVSGFQELRKSLDAATEEYKSLLTNERRQINAYNSERRARQLHGFLDGFEIRNSKIRGIGPAKQAALNSFGIESAADVTMERLMSVPGFGPSNSQGLIDWRKAIEQRFVFREQPTDTDRQEIAKIRATVAAKGAMLRKALLAGPSNLLKFAARLNMAKAQEDPALIAVYREREQAKCDLQFLGLPLPDVLAANAGRAMSAAITKTASTTSAGVPSCPRCGSAMVRRTARRGANAGGKFWGCSRFPQCKGTRN
jgi:DNA-binding helix-hairpin-helix protein with protein kinase domain